MAGYLREAIDHPTPELAIEVSVVMPCLNEEQTVGECIQKAQKAFVELGVPGEVIVADNGSTDRSVEVAKSLGARVVHQPERGYGNAYLAGLAAARGRFIVMGDSDNTYDFSELPRFVELLGQGQYDLVIGSRLRGDVRAGAMPFLHRYVGTPVLSAILNLFFGVRVSDTQSGMRGLTREAYQRLRLRASGMEFASEMIVQAARNHLRIAEIPITYYPRQGESKLRTFRDGWRHLRFLLLHSPTYLFLIPGLTLLAGGLLLMLLLSFGRVYFTPTFSLDIHAMIMGSLAAILGFQVVCLGFYAKAYAGHAGLDAHDPLTRGLIRSFTLEHGLVAGGIATLLGLGFVGDVFFQWVTHGFVLEKDPQLRPALWGLTLSVLGLQTIFASFFLGVLGIRHR